MSAALLQLLPLAVVVTLLVHVTRQATPRHRPPGDARGRNRGENIPTDTPGMASRGAVQERLISTSVEWPGRQPISPRRSTVVEEAERITREAAS